MKHDRMYLEHVSECIEKIVRYCSDGRDAFFADERTQDAVVRNFEIIGEAVKQLSDETKGRVPDIPWADIAGFRDVLIHNYMGVKLNLVWNVVERELPKLRQAVSQLLSE